MELMGATYLVGNGLAAVDNAVPIGQSPRSTHHLEVEPWRTTSAVSGINCWAYPEEISRLRSK